MFNVHAKLVVMALMWASSYPLGRYLASFDAPAAIVAVRALVAGVFLIAIANWRGETPITLNRVLLVKITALGVCAVCIHNFLLFEALESVQANTGAVINGSVAIVVVVLDFLIFRRVVARLSMLGVGLSFVGAVFVITHGSPAELLTGTIGHGEKLFVVAVIGWAVYTIIARPMVAIYPITTLTAYSCLGGGLIMLVPATYDLASTTRLVTDLGTMTVVALHGILTLGLGFLWYYEGIHKIGPMNAAIYINMVPIFGVGLAAVTLGEVPDASLLLGGSLVVGGVILVNRTEFKRLRAA